MNRVAVATTSAIAADAARDVAARGGNAVDCALATAILSMNTEPGVCALAGGAYVTVWSPGHDPVTFDGNHAVPGRGLPPNERGQGKVPVRLDYGGGVSTIVGTGSVAVPGALAAIEKAWRRFGSLPWRELFEPTIEVVRSGFPLPAACHYYLGYSGELIFGRSRDGHAAVHDENGRLRERGSLIRVPHLADSLAAIADRGASVFYEGELAEAIAAHVRQGGGALTRDDLAAYEAVERPALVADINNWHIATNPPPAVGGAVLSAMLLACGNLRARDWDRASLDKLVRVQRACLDFRRDRLDVAADVGAAAAELIRAAKQGRFLSQWSSSSTVHTSAVDDSGMGCAVTASSGYGSGEMPDGTGLWLNNGLGEIELNRRDVDSREPGERLPSNMAPTVARSSDATMAIGSPGADRITTAIHQVLVNTLQFGMSLDDAIAHPRIHVDTTGEADKLRAEPGLDLPALDLPLQSFPDLNMYFGGVSVARFDRRSGFEVAADARREGGVFLSDA
ncbi:MAG TPA: gamma-glutamyltransferase [Woeseiaceae bacterium]|nr:gamma-glutamyltransferase [Woeseiaceae bacterium]